MRQSGCEVPDWTLRLKPRSKKQRRNAELKANRISCFLFSTPVQEELHHLTAESRDNKEPARSKFDKTSIEKVVSNWRKHQNADEWLTKVYDRSQGRRKTSWKQSHSKSLKSEETHVTCCFVL